MFLVERLLTKIKELAPQTMQESIGAVLWAWLSRCMECTAVLCAALLRDVVASKQHRIQLLAVLSGRDTASAQGLHLSDDALGARVVEATLPLLATFEAALLKMPLIVPKDLKDVAGLVAALPIEHFVRHQGIVMDENHSVS